MYFTWNVTKQGPKPPNHRIRVYRVSFSILVSQWYQRLLRKTSKNTIFFAQNNHFIQYFMTLSQVSPMVSEQSFQNIFFVLSTMFCVLGSAIEDEGSTKNETFWALFWNKLCSKNSNIAMKNVSKICHNAIYLWNMHLLWKYFIFHKIPFYEKLAFGNSSIEHVDSTVLCAGIEEHLNKFHVQSDPKLFKIE